MKDNEKDLDLQLDDNASKDTLEEKDGVKYETNDSWQFDAKAPTLDDDIFADKDYSVDTNALKVERKQPAKEEKVNTTNKSTDIVIKREKVQFAFLAILLVAIIAVLAFLGVRYYTVPNGKEGKLMNPASVVAKVDDTKVSIGMFNYYYSNIVGYYETYASSVGLDTSSDYATQYTTDEDGNQVSWLDFFEQETMEEIKQTVAYYNAGIEAGITLNDDQQSLIDDYIDNFKTSASSEGVSLDEYLQENVGDYCTESTLRLFYEQYFISSAYQGYYRATQTVTDEQVNEYFENNSSDYYQINFSYLAVEYDETDDTTAAESQATVEGYINQITDRDSILALVPTVYKDYIDQDVESAMESDSTLSEEDATEEAIAVYEQSIDATISASSSPFDDDFNDWLFSDDTPIGSTNYYVDSSIGYAYIILKTEQPTLSEDDTYTVRHILVTPETDDEDRASDYDFTDEEWAAALEKANEIVSEYNSGDKTELSFALLAEKYSDDTASTVTGLQGYYGGLYEDVTEGTMTSEFQNWALDESRVYGDTEIVKSSYGYHIMYFINHVPSYQASIISQIKDDAVEASIEDCNLKTHTSVLNKAVDKYYASKSTSTDD